MRDDNEGAKLPFTGPDLSRRTFMYGTAAAAAGAVLLHRVPGTAGPGRARTVAHVVRPLTGSSGSFTLKQTGPFTSNNGSVTPTLSTGSTAGNLLVATIQGMTTDGSALGSFSAPSGWQLAKSVADPAGTGRAEIWYYPGTPDSIGCASGVTSITFTATDSGAICRGFVTEFSVPSGSNMMAVLDAPGQAAGASGGTFPLTAASGNVGNSLGIDMDAAFFGSTVSGTWSGPGSGWSSLRVLGGTVANPWAVWYNAGLSAGIQSISTGFSVTGENGWVSAFAAFRGVVFQPVYLGGGEMTTIVALDPTGQEIILAGDVEGSWRSADGGNHWQPTQDGLFGSQWRCNASLAWSQTVAGEVYACVGKATGSGDGGFLVSTDGGVTWTMRAPASAIYPGETYYSFLNFQANSTQNLLPSGVSNDQDRSVGHLIAQTTVSSTNYLFLATYNSGVARSSNDGTSWVQVGPTSTNGDYYLRALVVDPATAKGLYAGAWLYTDTTTSPATTYGGLYHTSDATVSSPTWTSVGLPSGIAANSTVSDIKVLGSNLYVTFADYPYGLYLYQPSSSTWYSLNGGLKSTGYYGTWTSIDGYVSGSSHVLVAANSSGSTKGSDANYSNVVQITVTPSTGAVTSTVDLTAAATIVTSSTLPASQPWWRASASWHNWLGGAACGNPHVTINPQNTSQIFLSGSAGFFVTSNAGASCTWNLAITGNDSIAAFDIATDPNNSTHYVVCGDDYAFIDVSGDNSGYSATVTQPSPPSSPSGDNYETHAAVFDPRSSITVGSTTYHNVVYVGFHDKYGSTGGENGDGDVYWSDSTSYNWYGTGFYSAVGGDAPAAIYVSVSGSTYYLVVSTIGNGIWRSPIPAVPTTPGNWSWTQVNSTACTYDKNTVQCMPITGNAAGTNLYLFDRGSSAGAGLAIWRSTNSGSSWTSIYTLPSGQTVSDPRSGWIALNPHPTGTGDEVWFSTSEAIFKITNAAVGSSPTVTNMSGSFFPFGAGAVVFTSSSATLYAVSLSGTNGTTTQGSTQLLSLANGSSSTAWANGDPANSFGSYISWPGPAALTAASSGQQTLLVGAQPNLAVYANVSD